MNIQGIIVGEIIIQKIIRMQRKQRILTLIIFGISLIIIVEFLLEILTFNDHWWILICWFFPVFTGLTISSRKRKRK